jgi:hypothetical protein
MATFSPVLRLIPSLTLEKWPVPRVSPISYSSMIAWSMSESLTFSISTPAQCTGRGRGLVWPDAAIWSGRRTRRPRRKTCRGCSQRVVKNKTTSTQVDRSAVRQDSSQLRSTVVPYSDAAEALTNSPRTTADRRRSKALLGQSGEAHAVVGAHSAEAPTFLVGSHGLRPVASAPRRQRSRR